MASSLASKKKKDGKKVGGEPFEFCELCNLNHDQGRRHKYFPAHGRAFANTLSRFQKKLSELHFFIRNPILLRPEHYALNRFWCVFCAVDIDETGSYFVCGNAIRHMAGEEHLRNLKKFLWKHGKGTDRRDFFVIAEEDLLKWEKNCVTMKVASSSSTEGPIGPMRPSKVMRVTDCACQMALTLQLLPISPLVLLLCQWAFMEMGVRIRWAALKI